MRVEIQKTDSNFSVSFVTIDGMVKLKPRSAEFHDGGVVRSLSNQVAKREERREVREAIVRDRDETRVRLRTRLEYVF
ncbi:hypothetical protein SDJN03_09492, partial [Cucurbita argyrosperma subsp. sororia]